MKKVIFISYFFPPANFVGSLRVAAWVKHLPEYDIYPVVITRQWNENQKDLVDRISNNQLVVEKTDTEEIHRLPYSRSLRDRVSEYPKLWILQKMLTFLELILSNLFIKALPFANFHKYTKTYIKENPDVTTVLISARPFQAFFIGHSLKRRFPQIEWIADYRDDWTNGLTYKPNSRLEKFVHSLEKRSERKWLANVSMIISPSNKITNILSSHLNKPGHTILNGFEESSTQRIESSPNANGPFSILYTGTVYENQNVELLLQAIAEMDEEIHVEFIGADTIPNVYNQLLALRKKYSFLTVSKRIPKPELLTKMTQADAFFATSFEGMDGFIPVKCYDYLNWKAPVMLYPSNDEELKSFILNTNCGEVAQSKETCIDVLTDWVKTKSAHGKVEYTRSNIEQYSRKFQSEKLAKLLHQVT